MSDELRRAALAVRLARTGPVPTQTVLDGEVCLYAPEVTELLVLNASASAIWAATAPGDRSAVDLLAEVALAFGVSQDDIAADVLRTLERFLAAGLLGVVADG